MTISDLFFMPGGLGLFLYGMSVMRKHLEQSVGEKTEQLLRKLSATPVRGFLAGTGITAAVQSSTAVMVLLVGFVDAGIFTLKQSVWVILGANIGTTVTGQLMAFPVTGLAPVLIAVGIIMRLFWKQQKGKQLGGAVFGLGLMFLGLAWMENTMAGLENSRRFQLFLAGCSSPLTGIPAGILLAAILQSSSASVGLLQTLSRRGLLDVSRSMYLVFGQNIGTCITALLAAAGACTNAKRTAVLHLFINVLGTAFFLVLVQLLPLGAWIEAMTPGEPTRQIANIHTAFNVVTSLVLLPFAGFLVKAAEKLVPER